MAWGKTEDEKRAEADARAVRAYQASPVGKAEAAAKRGDRFFQVTIEASLIQGQSRSGFDFSSTTRHHAAPDVLGQIEELGWRLEHVGYVFVQTGTESREKVFSSGERESVTGRVEGLYLFRSVSS